MDRATDKYFYVRKWDESHISCEERGGAALVDSMTDDDSFARRGYLKVIKFIKHRQIGNFSAAYQ